MINITRAKNHESGIDYEKPSNTNGKLLRNFILAIQLNEIFKKTT